MNIFIIIVGLIYIPDILYFKFGFFKTWFHDILGWHQPDTNKVQWFDGCSEHATCKYCGRDIMRDSQGNWF